MGGLLTRLFSSYYLRKIKQDSTVLHYQRKPTWRSLVLFTVLFVCTHFISIQAISPWLVAVCYILGLYFCYVATEKYEEVIFDKSKGTVSLMNTRFLEKHFLGYRRKIVSELSEIVSVSVESQKISYGGTGHQVVLLFLSGLTLSVTAQCTFGDKSEHEAVSEEIKKFLELPSVTQGKDKQFEHSKKD